MLTPEELKSALEGYDLGYFQSDRKADLKIYLDLHPEKICLQWGMVKKEDGSVDFYDCFYAEAKGEVSNH